MPTNAPFIVFTSPDPSSDDAKPEDPVALQLRTLYCDEISGHTQRLKAIEDLAKGLGLSLEDLHGVSFPIHAMSLPLANVHA
ncbi:uncharacterized protein J4E88_009931 [Alternaria novae-zelandiae]|uniref:uncharacterized protein n=1 Tax=Alternaria novae-zelandiae TaxID=430562 RepID=UPI0020C2EC69|nr:uncharacterized protein J4E88_009931 [Alternaria novae-zelandiae]KAI4669649.1 hypothetical protein J4E88_009931 [Alternaria novae-zelandiae]